MSETIRDAVRRAARQEQFLEVVSREEAWARLVQAVPLTPVAGENVALEQALGRVLARSMAAPNDVPFFDRSNVDGFAVRAADTVGASEAVPVRLRLNGEVLACGVAPRIEVLPGTGTIIATGGVIPRGADAVVMVERTDIAGGDGDVAIEVGAAASAGAFITYAGSDVARGETMLHAGARLGSREIGILAAAGLATIPVVRRPRVAVLSTGDELIGPGEPIGPGRVHDSNGAVIAAAVAENGGEAVSLGVVPDNETALARAIRAALDEADIVVLSGGTSKGAGDLSRLVLDRVEGATILVHGVALKPGKPLCLAVAGGKPLFVLPGFPTSAMFTFHAFAAPVIRAMAGLPAAEEASVRARLPVRLASERGRTEFAMVALAEGAGGELAAFPLGKGSGAVTAFARADGFIEVPALQDAVEAGTEVEVWLIDGRARPPDLVIAGSHCVGLDRVVEDLAARGLRVVRIMALGSLGGLAAARRGECDLAPIHLLDPATGTYNQPFLTEGLTLVPGWRRMQGVIYRAGDERFEGRNPKAAVLALLASPDCLMVNRNQGSGTRMLIDDLLQGARPRGYSNQPKSHNAVAAAVTQGRADWGVAISTVARDYGLGFLTLAQEHYDFALVEARRARPAVAAFLDILADEGWRGRLRAAGFEPA